MPTPVFALDSLPENMIHIAVLHHLTKNPHLLDLVEMHPLLLTPARQLMAKGLLKLGLDCYELTPGGHKHLCQLRDLFDRVLDLELLARVNVARALGPDLCGEDGVVYADKRDPRFVTAEQVSFLLPTDRRNLVDMRIWIMEMLNTVLGDKAPISPHVIVFTQRLIDNQLPDLIALIADLNQNTRSQVFQEIDQVVQTAYRLAETPNAAPEHTPSYWFAAAMHELVKRRGATCSQCKLPLGVYEAVEQANGAALTSCPGCQASFEPPPPLAAPTYSEQCPACSTTILPHHRFCRGCNSTIDRSLHPGEIVDSYAYDVYVPLPVFYTPDPFEAFAVWGALSILIW